MSTRYGPAYPQSLNPPCHSFPAEVGDIFCLDRKVLGKKERTEKKGLRGRMGGREQMEFKFVLLIPRG